MKKKKLRKEKQNVVIGTRHKRLTLKDMQNAEGAQSFLRTESNFGTWVSRMSRGPAADWILCSACVMHLHVKLKHEIRVKTTPCYMAYTNTCSCTLSSDQLVQVTTFVK